MRFLFTKITALMLMIIVSSCTEEELIPNYPSTNEAIIRFTLPNRSLVDVGAETRAAKNDFEKKISNLDLFVIEVKTKGETAPADDAEVIKHYKAFVDNDGEISTLVNPTKEPCWVVALVNASDDNITVETFNDIANLNEDLTSLYSSLSTVGTTYANNLPMSGMQYFDEISIKGVNLELKHICARIDVTSTASGYMLESATLLNGANAGHYIAQSPLREYNGTDLTEYQTTTISETPYIYLYENGGAKNYTDLIIAGKYTISEGNIVNSYIKVKLEYGSPLTADILRNTNYKVNLKSISKSNIGYDNIEDAKSGEYSDAEIEIEIGSEALSDMTVGNGDYYMSFSNSEYRAYAPSGTKNDLTAFSLHFDRNSNLGVNMDDVKKEISLGSGSKGITLVDGPGDKTSTWKAASDIDIKVDLEDNASGTIIVRIGNLAKEIKIVREQNNTNLPTAFNDDNYVYAKSIGEASSWLKIATKEGTPEAVNELHSSDGFTLNIEKDMWGTQSAELFLARDSEKGRTRVYIEQYAHLSKPLFSYNLSDNFNINYLGQVTASDFSVTSRSGNIVYLDGSTFEGDLPWIMEFTYDNGLTWTTTKPDWIDMPTSGDGDLADSDITVASQPIILTGNGGKEQEKLRAASPLGSVNSPYNLSNSRGEDAVQNTANCYIVNAPGTYKLPLIYGNAFKDGKDNPSSYTSDGVTGYYVLENFVKHDDKPITKPQIEGAKSAIICWQDAENLISDVTISDNYLVFNVDQETIMEGNAIVAIQDAEDTILWSWHIWVTNYTDADDQDVYYSEQYVKSPNNYNSMMNVFLGWCNQVTKVYGESVRTVKMRATQSFSDNKLQLVSYSQKTGKKTIANNAPYYQAGRKDPMLPGTISYNLKENYGELPFDVVEETTSYGQSIQNPNILYFSNYKWIDPVIVNSWSAKVKKEDVYHEEHIKTVYDPTPVGYIVPHMAYFSGFTLTGENSEDPSEFNVSGVYSNGWNFFTKLNKEGSSIYFPSLGCRLGEVVSYYSYSFVASSRLFFNGWNPVILKNDEVRISPPSGYTSGVAANMRPVKDKR